LKYVEEHGEQWKYPELWNKGRLAQTGRQGHCSTARKRMVAGCVFEARVRMLKCDGKITSTDAGLKIEGAQEVVLALAAASSFNGFDKSPSREGVEPATSNIAGSQKT